MLAQPEQWTSLEFLIYSIFSGKLNESIGYRRTHFRVDLGNQPGFKHCCGILLLSVVVPKRSRCSDLPPKKEYRYNVDIAIGLSTNTKIVPGRVRFSPASTRNTG